MKVTNTTTRTAVTTSYTDPPKKTKKTNTVPVGQRSNTNKPQKTETSMDRVKRTYHEKGFFAAAWQYLKEAFGGPSDPAERERYQAAESMALSHPF